MTGDAAKGVQGVCTLGREAPHSRLVRYFNGGGFLDPNLIISIS